jgi:TolB protein
MGAHGRRNRRAIVAGTLLLLVLIVALSLAACGASSGSASGSPRPAAQPSSPSSSGTPLPSPTVAGTILFTTGDQQGLNYDIYVVASDGTGLAQVTDDPGVEEHASWSPDGERIVYDAGSQVAPDTSIYVMNADGSAKARLTKGYHPHWSPDGKRIAFVRYFADARGEDIYVMNADGSGVRRVVSLTPDDTDPSWLPDGRILFTRSTDVFAVRLDGRGMVRLTKAAQVEDSAASPDGKMLAYHDLDGDHVVVVPMPGAAGNRATLLEPVSAYVEDNLEVAIAWAPDEKALALAGNDGGGPFGSRLYVVNADGSGLSAVPGVANALDPAWRPQ